MSWQPAAEARCTEQRTGAAELIVEGRLRELPGLSVRRTLPTSLRRHVGPFVFLDHMGPIAFEPGRGIDIPPHPHIGLATVTYLVEGEILHRDSLGSEQRISPGDVNWMSAGRGIVHSERTPVDVRARRAPLHGLQAWVALPRQEETSEPSFQHHAASAIPSVRRDGVELRVIAGEAYGATSPVAVLSRLFYVEARMTEGASLAVPDGHAERAAHVIEGAIECDGRRCEPGTLIVFREGADGSVRAETASRVMFLGGEPLDGERHIWWNFVSSSKERIEQAKSDWKAGRFPRVPGDETEFVPLP